MLLRFKLRVGDVINNPNARVVFILGTLILAVLVGGAPNDRGH